jgi:4,5-dihydroxyphthalate decarboxylase
MKDHTINRRDLMKTAATVVGAGALGVFSGRKVWAASTDKLQATAAASTAKEATIKVAGYDYDRVRAIMDGQAGMEGAEVNFHVENIYAANKYAFGPEGKYEVTELGLIPYIVKYINEDFRAYTPIPVFISRSFRHRNVFVHADSGIKTPQDLRGKRVGTPGYGTSANTWILGFLLDEYGVKADEMQWIETTKSSDGGTLKTDFGKYFLPDDFPIVKGPPGVDESELLLSGGCDALIAAITPKAFLDGNPKITRLFPDVRAAEIDYYKKTGVFPLMHVVAIRTDSIKANPGLPKAVFEMYSKAKQIAYANLETTTSLKVTLPWVTQEFEDTRKLMGKNFWPYGIEANRKELELVMRYTHEQGLVKRRLKFEELFHPSTLELAEDES